MFKGAFTAIVTPFKDNKIDYEKYEELVEFQIENGINGLVPCGTTGESATQSFEEHKELIKKSVEIVNGRVPVIAGTGSNNTEEALKLTVYAKEVGADGALVITPYYNKPTQEGLFKHFKKIATSVSIPVVLYNVPSRTGINMLPETVARLSELENIVAIKEASGSISQVCDIMRLSGGKITVISGDDALFYPMLAVGGRGVISVVANVAPKDTAELFNQFEQGNLEKVKELHYKLLPLIKGMFLETNPIPAKTALKMMGKLNGELRLPMCEMSDKNQENLKKILTDYGLI